MRSRAGEAIARLLAVIVILAGFANAFKDNEMKKCSDLYFCRRLAIYFYSGHLMF